MIKFITTYHTFSNPNVIKLKITPTELKNSKPLTNICKQEKILRIKIAEHLEVNNSVNITYKNSWQTRRTNSNKLM